ncbi:MAG: DUF4007 family protein [Spirosoma sp.]|nr:DUF4007 family protein [Spirosoma sp.]
MQTLRNYQKFGVDIREITKILVLIEQDEQSLQAESGLNYAKVRGIKEYLTDFGLISSSREISELGYVIRSKDKKLNEYFSKWICLYNWSLKNRNTILHYIMNEMASGAERVQLINEFETWAFNNDFSTNYEKDYISGILNRTINALIERKSDNFQSLNLFALHNNRLYRSDPYNVHPLLVAYILYDNRHGRVSISINELMQEPGNIGKFFGYDSRSLEMQLSSLQELGLAKRVQSADLNMINYLYDGTPLSLVERYYNENL